MQTPDKASATDVSRRAKPSGASAQIRSLAEQQGVAASDLLGSGGTDEGTLKLALTAANRLTHEILEGLSANDLRAASTNSSAVLKKNNGNFNLGFSNWNYAQTDKNAISTQNPWQLFNILSLYAGYENDNFYGYFLYTFNDNTVGQWLGYKFRIGNNGEGGKQAKKWDVYAVFTEYPSGALPYAGIGLEHSWDIQGPLSISYFVEGGVKDNFTSWSTGFILNCQQGILRTAKK